MCVFIFSDSVSLRQNGIVRHNELTGAEYYITD